MTTWLRLRFLFHRRLAARFLLCSKRHQDCANKLLRGWLL